MALDWIKTNLIPHARYSVVIPANKSQSSFTYRYNPSGMLPFFRYSAFSLALTKSS